MKKLTIKYIVVALIMFGVTSRLSADIWFASPRNVGINSGGPIHVVGDDQVGYATGYAVTSGLGVSINCSIIDTYLGVAQVYAFYDTNSTAGGHYIGYFPGGDDCYLDLAP